MRTVLITGGSRGIGRATVRRFAEAGDRVFFTYRTGQAEAEALIAECGGADVRAFYLDQGDWASHERFLAELPAEHPIDVLVNNAAYGSKTVQAASDVAHEQDTAMLQVNAVGPLWLIKRLLPAMRERRSGRLIQIGSVNGGVTQFAGFSLADGMSKAALAFMTRQLAAETIYDEIYVFALCPGAVETPMFEASTLARLSPEERKAFVASLPKGRLITPAEIGEVIYFLASDAARVLNGAVIDASLGLGSAPGVFATRNPYL